MPPVHPMMNCRSLSAALLVLTAAPAFADHVFTSARWDGWTVETGEEVWYSRRHVSYPIWNMFDGDPKTAWVYSGGFEPRDATGIPSDISQQSKSKPSLPARYWVQLTPLKARTVDTIRLMNGYNKSSATFGRNARVIQIDVFATNKLASGGGVKSKLGTYRVDDAMGWQSLKIPQGRYAGLRIEVTAIHRGSDPDVAISELQLLNHGQNVGPHQPRYLVYDAGDECGDGAVDKLMTAKGRVLAKADLDAQSIQESPKGRYFCGGSFEADNKTADLWVYDAVTKKRVWVHQNTAQIEGQFDDQGRLRELLALNGSKVKYGRILWLPPAR